jgi:hypothetical protein
MPKMSTLRMIEYKDVDSYRQEGNELLFQHPIVPLHHLILTLLRYTVFFTVSAQENANI